MNPFRMHFIFLTLGYHPDLAGGAYRYVTEVAQRLAQRDCQVDVICPNPENQLPAIESRSGVHLFRYQGGDGFFLSNWRVENLRARKLLQERLSANQARGLLVLCHSYFGPSLKGLSARNVYLFTGPWAKEYRLAQRTSRRSLFQRCWHAIIATGLQRTESQALQRTDRILTISRYYVESLKSWHNKELPPVEMISGGVDFETFRPMKDRAMTRLKLGLEPDQFFFLAVRRLDPRMGLVALVEGFGRIATEFPRAQLWIAGKGPQREALEARVKELGLGKQVRLLGFVAEEDLPGLLNAADCTMMPSLDLEGFGLATVESLACGTPVLGSSAGATPELLAPLNPELVFDANSGAALTEKLRKTLRNPNSLPSSSQCREYVLSHFSWDRPVAAFQRCYSELVSLTEK